MLLNILVALVSLSIVLIGSLVLIRSNKFNSGRVFALFCITVGCWIAANYVGANFKQSSLAPFFVHVDFFLGAWMAYIFYWFTREFTLPESKKSLLNRINIPLLIVAAATSIASLGGTFVTISRLNSGLMSLEYTQLYNIYAISLAIPLLAGIALLFVTYRLARGIRKRQIGLMFRGIAFAVVFVAAANLLLPLITTSKKINLFAGNAAYLAIAFFIATTAYAIARHKLFDIRTFVVRALVYVSSITVIGLLYSLLVYGVGGLLLNVDNVNYVQRATFAVLALLIAVTYAPILRFFNKYTARIFFRDAYSTQEVLDEIGKIIVGNIDLHRIEKSSLAVLNNALKTTYLGFVFKDSEGNLVVQDFLGEVPRFDEVALKKSLITIGRKEMIYDEIEQSTSEKAQLLRKNDISLVLPLITKNETVGYIVSGPKKSGNIFNQQDRSMLNIAGNELAVALQNAQRFEEIQAFNITLQAKVDEATKELKKTNKKLLELDEAKDEFISMASHQLRTPLTSIKGYLSMLMDGDLGKVSKEQDQALKEAFTSSQRMVFLISDFLNVSRIKTGKFVIEPKVVNLSDMVSQEMLQLREMAEAKQLKMTYAPPADFPLVNLDENKMHQVMMNMMDNAIYYTANGGNIMVQLYIDGKDVVFKVIDTGIGVPKAEQHKLFTKFFRAGNARKTRPDGTGLGLFMAQKVVVAQGGSILFESEEGKGSTFGFRFALKDIKA